MQIQTCTCGYPAGTVGGFLTKADVAKLAACAEHRLAQLLIRWHEGRCVAGAQYVADMIAATERGGWCVRDVCWPAGTGPARIYGPDANRGEMARRDAGGVR